MPHRHMHDADVVLKVLHPMTAAEGNDELALMKRGAVLIGILNPHGNRDPLPAYANAGVTALAMELVPRITRAQAMDVLSSQANLAGYRAVLDAASEFGRAFPMMMTAAGTVAAGAGADHGRRASLGLQAIATARRLGAVVSATDVRPAAKEQVQIARRHLRRGRGRGVQASRDRRRLRQGDERRSTRPSRRR